MTPPETPDASIEEEIERTSGTNGGPRTARAFEDADAEAAFWRAQFEQERERLAKLWVAYRDLEAELELRKEEAERIAQRKAAATIAEDETEAGTDAEPEQPGVLAIAPPDTFEVVCEAQQREVPAGRGTSFGLVFANRGDEPVTAGLTVEDVPDGWSALPTETTIELDAHSSKTVYVLVRSPEDATPGRTVRVTVGVETPEGTAEPMELVAEVVEREDEIVTELEQTQPEPEAEPETEPGAASGPSPFGDIHEVEDVEGIGEVYGEHLRELGIEETEQLWQANVEPIADELDVSPRTVRRWQKQAELMALKDVGPQYAELLARSGVGSIDELAAREAGDLHEHLEEKQESLKIRIQGAHVNESRVEGWIERAREHDPADYRARRSGPAGD